MKQRWTLPRRVSAKSIRWPTSPHVFIAYNEERCREALAKIEGWDIVGVDVEAYGCDLRKESPVGKAKAISIQFSNDSESIFVPLWTVRGVGDVELAMWPEEDPRKDPRVRKWDIDPQGRVHLLDIFAEWLERKDTCKVLHNAKADRHFLANHGIFMRGIGGDTLVMDYYRYNDADKHGLKECMRRIFGEKKAVDYSDVFKTPRPLKKARRSSETGELEYYGKQKFLPDLVEVIRTQFGVDKLVEYAVKDPIYTVRLFRHLRDQLRKMVWLKDQNLNYWDFVRKIAMPYGDVLFDMEREGCPVDEEKIKDISARLDLDIEDAGKQFLKLCAKSGIKTSYLTELNLDSTQQMSDLLYEKLCIPCTKLTKKQQKSTGKAALEEIVSKKGRSAKATTHALIVEAYLKYKSRVTLRKMFIRPLLRFAPQYGGRIHSSFKQTGTATNRLASATPNVENIPANKKDEEYGLRSCFYAPPQKVWTVDAARGTVCVSYEERQIGDIDLKQIEVRFTADVSKDPTLIKLLQNKWDQHLIAMCMMNDEVLKICKAKSDKGRIIFRDDMPPNEALAKKVEEKLGKATYGEWRRRAKVLNFGIIYGMGPQGYVNQIGGGASERDGEMAIRSYFRGFPELRKGIKDVQAFCRQKGYIRTFLRRYCMIPDINSSIPKIRSRAERQAFNYRIQGGAADMIMLGMLLCFLDKRLRRWGVMMINQIHDEIVFLMRKKYAKKAAKIIDAYISRPYDFTQEKFGFTLPKLVVDTPADLGLGATWFEAKK